MTFNMALCFVNTKVGGVGNGAIIGCEIAVIGTVLLLSYPVIDYGRFLVVATALIYLMALAAYRTAFHGESIQIKPVRDLLIPIAFFFFGMRAADIRLADLLVQVAAGIVVAVGLIEYAFPDRFTDLFNIARFYIDRGSMTSASRRFRRTCSSAAFGPTFSAAATCCRSSAIIACRRSFSSRFRPAISASSCSCGH